MAQEEAAEVARAHARTRARRLERRGVAALVARAMMRRYADAAAADDGRADGQMLVVAVGRLELVDAFARRVHRATPIDHLVRVLGARILELALEQQKVDHLLRIVSVVVVVVVKSS